MESSLSLSAIATDFNALCAPTSKVMELKALLQLDLYEKLIESGQNPLDPFFRSAFLDYYSASASPNLDQTALFTTYSYALISGTRDYGVLLELQHQLADPPRHEYSYISKMLATINPSLPPMDSHIKESLTRYGSMHFRQESSAWQDPISAAVNNYRLILNFYEEFIPSAEGRRCIEAFDDAFGAVPFLTETKKIDYILWLLGKKANRDRVIAPHEGALS